MIKMTLRNLGGIIARDLGSILMLQTRIVKTGTKYIKRTKIVLEEMVHMSWKMVNLEKMGRSISLCMLPILMSGRLKDRPVSSSRPKRSTSGAARRNNGLASAKQLANGEKKT